ncbi:MAG: hypothetical protein ABI658_00590 [Acidimicrobiales bacterium]
MRGRLSAWKRCCVVAAIAAVAIGVGGIAVAGAGSGASNSIVPVAPVRILDTRAGTGAAAAPIGPDAAYRLTVAGVAGVPVDATGVLLNVTAVNGTDTSFLTVYPDGTARPNTSNLNWSDGAPHPNMVSVALGTGGAINFYNRTGQVDLIVDLAGYFTTAPTPPAPTTTAPTPQGVSALSAESIVESNHQWSPGPFPFNTTGLVLGTDISHDAVNAPESFVIARAGIYRVDYDVSDEGCCAYDGTFGVTVNGAPVNPISAIGDGGPGGGGSIDHTVIVDVATDGTTLQLLFSGGNVLYSAYAGGGNHSFASITIQRIGDRT